MRETGYLLGFNSTSSNFVNQMRPQPLTNATAVIAAAGSLNFFSLSRWSGEFWLLYKKI